jgi:hypothetical protein
MKPACCLLPFAVLSTLALAPAKATIRTDGPLMEPEHQTLKDLREINRQAQQLQDQRQHEVRIAVAIGGGLIAAGFVFYRFRRRG